MLGLLYEEQIRIYLFPIKKFVILIQPSKKCAHYTCICIIMLKCKIIICFRIAHETMYNLFKSIKLEDCSKHIIESVNCLDTTVDIIMHKLGPCIIK